MCQNEAEVEINVKRIQKPNRYFGAEREGKV